MLSIALASAAQDDHTKFYHLGKNEGEITARKLSKEAYEHEDSKSEIRGAPNVVEETHTVDNGANVKVRRLQQTIEYEFTMLGLYEFPTDFILDTSLAEVRDVIRLTQIFYRRLFSQKYPQAYVQSRTQFLDGEIFDSAEPPTISLEFNTTVTFRLVGDVPTSGEALADTVAFNELDYLFDFVHNAFPPDLFPL